MRAPYLLSSIGIAGFVAIIAGSAASCAASTRATPSTEAPRVAADCEEGAKRESAVESCVCLRSHPEVAYPTPDSDIALRWSCSRVSDAQCRSANVGSACSSPGLECTIQSGMCISFRACSDGRWTEPREQTCAP